MTKLLLILGSCALAVTAARADEPNPALYVGELMSVQLVRTLPQPYTRNAPLASVVVNNGCGHFRARFKVLKTVLGPSKRSVEVTGSVGEWCNLPFNASLNPIALWVTRRAKTSEYVHSLPAYEIAASEFAVVPFGWTPCVDAEAIRAWSAVPQPIPLGVAGSLAPSFLDGLRKVDALLERDGEVYAQRAVILKEGFDAECSD
jgi:hypothetical protein